MSYDVAGTIEYYINLLLYQYSDKPKARQTIGLLSSQAIADLIVLQVNDAFDLTTASGPQLDILGEYIGFSRIVPVPIPQPYFQLDDYFSPIFQPVGMTDYTDPQQNLSSIFYLYIFQNKNFSSLNDDQYKFMLTLKIILNSLYNSLANINNALLTFFGTSVICADQADMSISYFIQGTPSYLLQLAVELNLLPKPMGVRISGVFAVSDATKIFKMQDYTFDTGGNIEFSNYQTGFNDKIILDYRNKVA